jgi:protein dithiol oxidoreductase (disulfide-forming)
VQKNKSINSKEDIRQVFIKAGIPAEEYDGAAHSFMVKSITAKQKNALEAFGVRGTPSFYVDGQYQIKNDGMQSKTVEGYRTEYADVVKFLIDHNK